MKKIVFPTIFFFLVIMLALWGYCEFFIQGQSETVVEESAVAVNVSKPKVTDSVALNGDLEMEKWVGPVDTRAQVNAIDCDRCQKDCQLCHDKRVLGPLLLEGVKTCESCGVCHVATWWPPRLPLLNVMSSSKDSSLGALCECATFEGMRQVQTDQFEGRSAENVDRIKESH